MAAAQGQAGHGHGVVGRAVEVAGDVADGEQAADDGAVLAGDLHVLVNVHAEHDGRQADVATHTVEGRVLHGHQPLGCLAEVLVGALGAQLVVALDRGDQVLGVHTELLGELLDGVGLVGGDEALVHADLLALLLGHVGLDGLLVVELAGPLGAGGHVVGVEDLVVVAAVLGAVEEVRHRGHLTALLVAEAVAVVLHREEGHVAHGAGAAVEVMQDAGGADVLHLGTRPHGHLVAVAGAAVLLAVDVGHLGGVVAHHVVVVHEVARGEDDALGGVELHVRAVGLLGDDAGDVAGLVLNKLAGGRLIEDLEALALGPRADVLHAVARVVGLGAEVEGEVAHGVVVDVLDRARPLGGGVDHLGAGLLAEVPQPLQGLAGVVGPQHDLVMARAVRAVLVDEGGNGCHAGRVGLVLEHGVAGVALAGGGVLLLEQGDLGTGLEGRDGGGHTGGTGADDHDVVVIGLGDVGDGVGLGEEGRRGRGVGDAGALGCQCCCGVAGDGCDGGQACGALNGGATGDGCCHDEPPVTLVASPLRWKVVALLCLAFGALGIALRLLPRRLAPS